MKLKVCDFNFTNHEEVHKGLIAQDVEDVFPQAIKEYDGVLPVYQGYAIIKEIGTSNYLQMEDGNNMNAVLFVGKKIVLGKTKDTQDYIVSIKDVDASNALLIDSDIQQHLKHEQLFIHGILGKIKTIDPNQILALCVSSIQKIAMDITYRDTI
jgi:hypothetical protein